MKKLLIRNANLVNEGSVRETDVLIEGERITKIQSSIKVDNSVYQIDADGQFLIPGMIDDQDHFREPGLTHKADLATESTAAVAGGITSFMEMPNVNPQTTNKDALQNKYKLAKGRCRANFSFYMGATNTNIEDIKSLEINDACGIKAFLGASTGDLLVDDPKALELLFQHAPIMVVTHCEDSPLIWKNEKEAKDKYGKEIPMTQHPYIRSHEACYKSSSATVALAKKYDALLHVLHLTTAKELDLFSDQHRSKKRITAEVCVHHLWFDEGSYDDKGTLIKCNPSIKKKDDREALLKALNDGKLDVIATDHAPHTLDEKSANYLEAPAGMPLVQHALQILFDLAHRGEISHELIVDRACHAPADLFGVIDRGYLREGYYADMVIVNTKKPYTVSRENILYKCKWSPFEGHTFSSSIQTTIVNGDIVFNNGLLTDSIPGKKLSFNRSRF